MFHGGTPADFVDTSVEADVLSDLLPKTHQHCAEIKLSFPRTHCTAAFAVLADTNLALLPMLHVAGMADPPPAHLQHIDAVCVHLCIAACSIAEMHINMPYAGHLTLAHPGRVPLGW